MHTHTETVLHIDTEGQTDTAYTCTETDRRRDRHIHIDKRF